MLHLVYGYKIKIYFMITVRGKTSIGPNTVTSGLILNLDAGNTKSYPGSGTLWKDLSGNNNGELLNNPTYNTSNGGNIVFNGTNSVNIGTIGGYSNNLTCEAVFKTTSSGTWKDIICGPNGDIIFTVNGSKLNFGSQGNSPIPHANYSTSDVNTGQWFHGVSTYDGTYVKIYINGILESTNNRTGNLTPGSISVGSASSGVSEFFIGSLALVKLYNKALTETEVLQNFNSIKSRFGL